MSCKGNKAGEKMTREEQLDFLIKKLISEETEYSSIEIPSNYHEKRRLLRALMNVRPPRKIDSDFLKVQDEFLSSEIIDKGIIDINKLSSVQKDKRLYIWQGDITTIKVDAIVNAANSALLGCFIPCHGCIDNAIHSASGIQLRLECNEIIKKQGFEEPTGSSKITNAYNLPCRYVIHTVGPIVRGLVTEDDCKKLSSCYLSCIKTAEKHELESIAFCCISTGEFHFPNEKAAQIAISTVQNYLDTNKCSIKKVMFNVFKDEDFRIYKNLLG